MQIEAQLDALNIGGTATSSPPPYQVNKPHYNAVNPNPAAAMLAAGGGGIHAQVPPQDVQQQQELAFDTTQRLLLGLQPRGK